MRSVQNNYKQMINAPSGSIAIGFLADVRGFSLIEVLVTLGIFSILMTGVFGAYISQLGNSTREYKIAESEVELGIAKGILLQDIQLAGYGLADDYGSFSFDPRAVKAVDGGSAPDELLLMGTALGGLSRASQSWTYIATVPPTVGAPTFGALWGDSREELRQDDRVVLMEPSSNRMLSQVGGNEMWLFKYNRLAAPSARLTTLPTGTGGSSGTNYAPPSVGTLVYGLYGSTQSAYDTDAATNPYYTARYYLGGASPGGCAPGTLSLLRGESVKSESPVGAPLLACVLDFQVALGLDTDEDGDLDSWDDGTVAGGYTADNLNKRLKQIKVYLLIQSGKRDSDYTYPLTTIRVGEGTSIGRDVDLTAAQSKYRWKLATMSGLPRNMR